jgi:hypothetical protein
MSKAKKSDSKPIRKFRKAETQDARETQLISLAVDLAEKQLMEGTASPSVINHYLKLGSSKDRLEREKLKNENELLRAKTETLQSAKEIEKLYSEALQAMRTYQGN